MNKNLRPWKRGQSGNPGGRPPVGKAIAELARTEIERRCLVEKLGAIAAGKSSQAVRACELLFGYAYGKPRAELGVEQTSAQEITVQFVDAGGSPIDTLRERIAQIAERERAALAAADPEPETGFLGRKN